MTGAVRLQTKLELPPGEPDLSDRLYLRGRFQVVGTHFSNEKIQSRVDALSMRSQGKPKLAVDQIPDNVRSRMGSSFVLKNSVLHLPHLVFEMLGTLGVLVAALSTSRPGLGLT
jgi:hypothetical protein